MVEQNMSTNNRRSKQVASAMAGEQWKIVELVGAGGVDMLRYRTPVLGPHDVEGYENVLQILWAYADADSGAAPSRADSEAMGKFEDQLSEALESDALAYLAAVLTFDGARTWIFYTGDLSESSQRIVDITKGDQLYPIERDAFADPEWSFLRTTLLERYQTNV
jgi:hypothetical protein